jgi:hypothetical protein
MRWAFKATVAAFEMRQVGQERGDGKTADHCLAVSIVMCAVCNLQLETCLACCSFFCLCAAPWIMVAGGRTVNVLLAAFVLSMPL